MGITSIADNQDVLALISWSETRWWIELSLTWPVIEFPRDSDAAVSKLIESSLPRRIDSIAKLTCCGNRIDSTRMNGSARLFAQPLKIRQFPTTKLNTKYWKAFVRLCVSIHFHLKAKMIEMKMRRITETKCFPSNVCSWMFFFLINLPIVYSCIREMTLESALMVSIHQWNQMQLQMERSAPLD